jgi:Flp pilus assembly pilin Flp
MTVWPFGYRLYHDRNMKPLLRFLKDEQGQDLIEYTLLVGFIALASAGIFIDAGVNVSGIWGKASTQLSAANAAS